MAGVACTSIVVVCTSIGSVGVRVVSTTFAPFVMLVAWEGTWLIIAVVTWGIAAIRVVVAIGAIVVVVALVGTLSVLAVVTTTVLGVIAVGFFLGGLGWLSVLLHRHHEVS